MLEEIFAYCSGKDILHMAETCKQFNAVIIASGKLLQKIEFDTTLWRSRMFFELPDRLKSRNYKNLSLVAIRQFNDMVCVAKPQKASMNSWLMGYDFNPLPANPTFWTMKFHAALSNLSLTELRIEDCTFTMRNVGALLRIVLPTLKSLLFTKVTIKDTGGEPVAIATESSLEALRFESSSPALLPYFSKCFKLKHFKFHVESNVSNEEFQGARECITNLLSKSTNLTHLNLMFVDKDFSVLDLSSWNFQLLSLRLSHAAQWIGLNDFLMKQPSIKSLQIYHTYEADLALPGL